MSLLAWELIGLQTFVAALLVCAFALSMGLFCILRFAMPTSKALFAALLAPIAIPAGVVGVLLVCLVVVPIFSIGLLIDFPRRSRERKRYALLVGQGRALSKEVTEEKRQKSEGTFFLVQYKAASPIEVWWTADDLPSTPRPQLEEFEKAKILATPQAQQENAALVRKYIGVENGEAVLAYADPNELAFGSDAESFRLVALFA